MKIVLGIDPGDTVGFAALSADGKILWRGELHLRKDIKDAMDDRRDCRRSRRNRKRYRKSRFSNRGSMLAICKVCGGNAPSGQAICRSCLARGAHHRYSHIQQTRFRLAPSIKARYDAILHTIDKLPFEITDVVFEDVYFDFQAMESPDISGEEYQLGPRAYSRNYKAACKTRDKWKCRVCGASGVLQVHHIVPRTEGGTDRLENLITLCRQCHQKHHKAVNEGHRPPRRFRKQKNKFRSATHAQVGKQYLQVELAKRGCRVRGAFGYYTQIIREKLGLPKSHMNDAIALARLALPRSFRFAKRDWPMPISVIHQGRGNRVLHWRNPSKKKDRKKGYTQDGRRPNNVPRKGGLQKNDIVRVDGKLGYISGFSGNGAYIRGYDKKPLFFGVGKSGKSKGKVQPRTTPLRKITKIKSCGSLIFLPMCYKGESNGN